MHIMEGFLPHPWFQPVYTPPNREVECLIFSLQAAIGSLIIGYFLIYYRASSWAKASNKEEENDKGLDAQPSR
jgi:cobalt/nickel transport protein